MHEVRDNDPIELRKRSYKKLVDQVKPRPPVVANAIRAFLVGGLICVIGQVFIVIFMSLGLDRQSASAAGSSVLIFLAALLTGIGVYDDIARFGVAGTVVPITGFANSMVAPALEYRTEGIVLGVGARLFTIAGPVLVFGIVTAWLVGIIYLMFSL